MVFDSEDNVDLCEWVCKLGCEFVVMVKGLVCEWMNKNFNCVMGDIEIVV